VIRIIVETIMSFVVGFIYGKEEEKAIKEA
jgi:hypothetical protein